MPELPEVETTKRGLSPHIEQQTVHGVLVREGRLRWPIPTSLPQMIEQQTLNSIERRAKYLLFEFDTGTLIAHLGMSGSMRIVSPDEAIKKHDHVDIRFGNDLILRYNDPRRFGAMLWTPDAPEHHKLLRHLGPEPLRKNFSAAHLLSHAVTRKINLKQLIMDQTVVVGVGNIYAAEALFIARVHPQRPAQSLKKNEATRLVRAIKDILSQAIEMGGTTLRDFVNSDGKPGYFKQSLLVYGRANDPCTVCNSLLTNSKINGRTTVFCDNCQC